MVNHAQHPNRVAIGGAQGAAGVKAEVQLVHQRGVDELAGLLAQVAKHGGFFVQHGHRAQGFPAVYAVYGRVEAVIEAKAHLLLLHKRHLAVYLRKLGLAVGT